MDVPVILITGTSKFIAFAAVLALILAPVALLQTDAEDADPVEISVVYDPETSSIVATYDGMMNRAYIADIFGESYYADLSYYYTEAKDLNDIGIVEYKYFEQLQNAECIYKLEGKDVILVSMDKAMGEAGASLLSAMDVLSKEKKYTTTIAHPTISALIAEKDAKIAALEEAIAELEPALTEKIRELSAQVEKLTAEKADLQKKAADLETQVKGLEDKNADLQKKADSVGTWQAVAALAGIVAVIAIAFLGYAFYMSKVKNKRVI